MSRYLKIRMDGRAKRVLAAWLGVCIVLNLVMGGLAPVGSYAGGEPRVVSIKISEEKIEEAIREDSTSGPDDWEEVDDRVGIPYSGAKRAEALDFLNSQLLGMTLVKTGYENKKYSYAVAAAGEEDAEGNVSVDQIILIGLNGYRDREIHFKLQITDADGIVIQTLTSYGYKWSKDAASGSEASGNDAEDTRGTESEATENDADDETASDNSASPDNKGTDSSIATDSVIPDDDDEHSSFLKSFEETLGEGEIEGLLAKKSASGSDSGEGHRHVPYAMASPGGIGMLVAESESYTGGDIGTLADIKVTAEEPAVDTGTTMIFNVTALYNNIDKNTTAYFAVKFKSEGIGDEEPGRYLTGPESSGAKPVSEADGAWQKVKEQVGNSARYGGYADAEWYKVAAVDAVYYYCPSAMLAVFGKETGSSTGSMPIQFQFRNGITPNGTTLTAEAEVLNEDEVIDAYLSAYPERPSQGKPSREEVKKHIYTSDADIVNEAEFEWEPVKKNITGGLVNGRLGNVWDGGLKNLTYTISANPRYGNNTSTRNLFTKTCTIRDRVTFDGFYIEGRGLTAGDASGNYALSVEPLDGSTPQKVLTFHFGKNVVEDFLAEPIWGDAGKITGIEFRYTSVNQSLKEDLQINGASGSLNVVLHLGDLWSGKLLKVEEMTGSASAPSVNNEVDLDAYSVSYKEGMTGAADEANHHHSHCEVLVQSVLDYRITKTAYTDANGSRGAEARGEKAVFEPNTSAWYTIEMANYGYKDGKFTLKDQLPKGVKLAAGTNGGIEYTYQVDGQMTPNGVEFKETEDGFSADFPLPAGSRAALTFKVDIEDADAFKDKADGQQGLNTTLSNTARWYRQSAPQEELGKSTATIYVADQSLTAKQLELEKICDKGTGTNPAVVGGEVVYTITAKLKKDAPYSQYVTITDEWPEKVRFTGVRALRSGATVVLRQNDVVLGRYTNPSGSNQDIKIGSFESDTGRGLTDRDAEKITAIDVIVYVEKGNNAGTPTKLVGTVKEDGDVYNKITGGSGEGGGPTADTKFYAVNMAIEKKAYYIAEADSENIDDGTIKNASTSVFEDGDVIWYEITVRNPRKAQGTTAPIAPVIRDDISSLFGDRCKPDFAGANLSGQEGSVFYQISDETKWTAADTPSDGKIRIDLQALGKEIPAGGSCTVRFYLTVPKDAVGAEVKSFTNTAGADLVIGQDSYTLSANVNISTLQKTEQQATISKEVYAVGKTLNGKTLSGARWFNSEISSKSYKGYENETTPSVNAGDYVLYKITIENPDEENTLTVYEIEDQLPAGMKFEKFYEFTYGSNSVQASGDHTLNLRGNLNNPTSGSRWLYSNGATPYAGIDFSKARIKQTEDGGFLYRARLFEVKNRKADKGKLAELPADGNMVFGIVAKATEAFHSTDMRINTAGMVVGRNTVSVDCGEEGTAWLGGDAIDGMLYTDKSYKVLTAAASVKGSEYAPGIEKYLSEYYSLGAWHDYRKEPFGVLPTDSLRWVITLHNGTYGKATSGPIEEYSVIDILPSGMAYHAEYPATLTAQDGTAVELPLPEEGFSKENGDFISWTVRRVAGGYEIAGKDTEKTKTTDKNMAIPVGKTLKLTVTTKPKDTTAQYGTYTNRADIIPGEDYEYSESSTGDIQDAEDRKSVYATAKVNIFGSGATESWKTITSTYHGRQYTASGTDDDDNYVAGDAGSIVTYGLNVKSRITTTSIDKLVVIDRLPSVGDNGLLNNAPRQSAFNVVFADKPNVAVYMQSGEEAPVKLDSDRYDVYYASSKEIGAEHSAIPASNWSEDAGSWQKKRETGDDCIKVVVKEDAIRTLRNLDTVTITFDAQLPSTVEKNSDKCIAWNAFGYAYHTGRGLDITVEPAKVGVQIPSAKLAVTKTVNSPYDSDKEEGTSFGFRLQRYNKAKSAWETVENGNFVLTAADGREKTASIEQGIFRLSNRQRAVFTVTANQSYRIQETDAEGYYVTIREFDSTLPETAVGMFDGKKLPTTEQILAGMDQTYTCRFTNTKNSLVLPEAGGEGTGRYHRAGAALSLLALLMLAGGLAKDVYDRRKRKNAGK